MRSESAEKQCAGAGEKQRRKDKRAKTGEKETSGDARATEGGADGERALQRGLREREGRGTRAAGR